MNSAGMCAHSIIKEQLEDSLNASHNLALLVKILDETHHVMSGLARLPTTPQLDVCMERFKFPVQTFHIIPRTSTHYKVWFYNTYCLDFQVKGNGLVYVKDAAISLFNQRKVMLEVCPIPYIKTFLMRYVEENALFRRQSQTEDDNPPSPIEMEGSQNKFQAPQTPNNPLTPSSPHSFLQSPPTLRQPSPANQPQFSPSSTFPVPSPVAPGSVGSPFAAQSPMAQPSPRPINSPAPGSNNPGKSNPSLTSRTLPQRLWAGSNPTPLTPQGITELCKPCVLQPPAPNLYVSPIQLSPLHRFLGCTFLKRFMMQSIKNEKLKLISHDQGTIVVKTDSLTCKIATFSSNNFQSLHLKLEPDPNVANQWPQEMLLTLEKFFDVNVASPPYRPNAFIAFCRILKCPINVLKDVVSIMLYEINPDLVVKNNLKWSCKLCLTLPPAAPPIMPLGQPGLLLLNEKMLVFLQLTKVRTEAEAEQAKSNTYSAPETEPLSVVIPLVYDTELNQTTVAQKEMNQVISVAQQHLAKLARSPQFQMQGRCTILPSVHDLLLNFSLEPISGPHPMQGQRPGNFS